MVLLPTANPFAVVAVVFKVAVPTPLAPASIGADPADVLPMVNVTVPANAPPLVELTVAVSVGAPPRANEVGFAVIVVVVGAVPEAVSFMVVVALEEKEAASP